MWARHGMMCMRAVTRSCGLPARAGTYVPKRQPLRFLFTSAQRFASEDPRSNLEQALPPGFEKVVQSPDALAAISKLAEVLEKNGFDLSGSQKPSMMQMAKLATNAEVREWTGKGMFARI